MHRRYTPAVALLLMFGFPLESSAQLPAAQSSITAAIGAVNFDVDGVATTLGVSGRGAVAVTPGVTLEGNVQWAENDVSTFGSKMWVVEAHVQWNWRAGRVRPYAGGGGGFFVNQGEFATDTTATLSAAGGLRVDVTDRLAALGELRIRGTHFNPGDFSFGGSLTEIWGGLTFRVGR